MIQKVLTGHITVRGHVHLDEFNKDIAHKKSGKNALQPVKTLRFLQACATNTLETISYYHELLSPTSKAFVANAQRNAFSDSPQRLDRDIIDEHAAVLTKSREEGLEPSKAEEVRPQRSLGSLQDNQSRPTQGSRRTQRSRGGTTR